jgi:hypothetical protein
MLSNILAPMKKNILILVVLGLLSSCSLGSGTKTDFTSLYQANVKEKFASLRDISEKFGLLGSYETIGSLDAMAEIPSIMSGSISTEYLAYTITRGIGQDSEIVFRAPRLEYETLLASGSLIADELAITTLGKDVYMKYQGLSGRDLIEEAMSGIVRTYDNNWLALTEADLLASLSGSSEDEKLTYQMSQAFGRMTFDDIEGYLSKYPIWQETESLGEVDGLSISKVKLSHDSIMQIAEDFAKKSTGKNLTETARNSLEESLSGKTISGTIGYDPHDPSRARYDIDMIGGMKIEIEERKGYFSLETTNEESSLSITFEKKEKDITGQLVMKK